MTGDRKVYCIGETVLDIIFQDGRPVAAKPGGSMLNSAVSLGRAGIPVYFISDYGTDQAGELIHGFLIKNGVSVDCTSRYSAGKTALALAFLDDRQNATYSFYRMFPEERLTTPFPVAQPGDMVLFGSFYALTPSIRGKVMAFIHEARSNGAFILYDPNFRSAHLGELEALKPWIMENMGLADLVRGSDEDFMHIFGATDARQAFHHVEEAGCRMLVYTRNSEGVEVIAPGYSRSYAVPEIRPVSTIGAGDAFNAGIIYALMDGESTLNGIPACEWDRIIGHGIRFSQNVCVSLENYISDDLIP